jgi:hypothetical protein
LKLLYYINSKSVYIFIIIYYRIYNDIIMLYDYISELLYKIYNKDIYKPTQYNKTKNITKKKKKKKKRLKQ